MNTYSPPAHDGEIDLRAYALTLWKRRWVILIVTLVAALGAFVVSYWLLPRQYQASAYVFIGQPAIEWSKSTADTGYTISPTVPDLNAVVKLSTSPGIMEEILTDPQVVAAFGNEEISLAGKVSAVAVGKDQLGLQVTDSDPGRVALLANIWAEKVAIAVNETYGLGAVAQALDSQVSQSHHNYDVAQAALEEALSNSPVDALAAQRDTTKANLEVVLGTIIRTEGVLDDLQFFEQGLSGLPGETPLSLGDGVALTTLRQRSLTVDSGSFTLQIDSASFSGFTVSNGLEAARQMRVGLQAQLTRLQGEQSRLEQEIPRLQGELSKATAQMYSYTLERDQSKTLYADMYQLQQRVSTVLEQNSKVASVSVEAVPAVGKSSPNVLQNTALAGMLGLILSVIWALGTEWWLNSGEMKKEN